MLRRFLTWFLLVALLGIGMVASFYAWVKFIKFCVGLPW